MKGCFNFRHLKGLPEKAQGAVQRKPETITETGTADKGMRYHQLSDIAATELHPLADQ